MPAEIRSSSRNADWTGRVYSSTTVVASPAAAAETIIGTVTVTSDIVVALGVLLFGWAAFTVGTTGANARLRLRQTGLAGTIVADTGATTGGIAAAGLVILDCGGLDTGAVLPGQVYALTLQVGSASAGSAVSGVQLVAFAV